MTRSVLGVLACGALLAGCAPHAEPAPSGQTPEVSVSVLREAQYRFRPAATPEQLVEMNSPDVVAIGRVEGIAQGRDLLDETDPLPFKNVVMRVRVTDEILTEKPGLVHRDRVYVELDQGGFVAPDNHPKNSLADFRADIPEGVRVMLFLHEWDAADGFEVAHARRGLPDGARLLQPDVQGIIFENPDTLVGGLTEIEEGGKGWTEFESIDEIGDRVETYVDNS